MTQTLFLDGRRKPLQIDLYGTAIQISGADPTATLAPVARIRRIACWGRVDWTGEALLACAERQIPISWLKRDQHLALFLPARPQPRGFAALLEEASLTETWSASVDDWLRSEARRSLTDSLRQWPSLATPSLMTVMAQDPLIAVQLCLRLSRDHLTARRIWRQCMALMHAWLAERLIHEELAAGHFGASSARDNLIRLFAIALSPLILPLAIQQAAREQRRRMPAEPLASSGRGTTTHRNAIAFDHLEPSLNRHFYDSWRRFDRMVRDLAERPAP